jgi:glycosyltransferase involved in cell wall biosynthesis
MKLLISTYACAPNHGSEHAVGWNWTTEAHRQGHRVWALVAPAHRASIAAACRADPSLAGIVWMFPEVPLWPLRQGIEPKRERTYNLLWQLSALRHARRLQREVGFDLIHHLTWAGIRAPTFLGSLGPPLIVGPIGGGETTPAPLRDEFHAKAKLIEWIRDVSNATIAVNPIVRKGLADASAIFVKTPDTRDLLTPKMQAKSLPFIELSLQPTQIGQPRGPRPSALKLLFAGRLLYWKGAHIVLRSFATVLRQIPDARLTIVGKGPEQNRLQALATSLQIAQAVEFVAWLPQPKLFDLYASHDLFVFPSLHDSGGTVVAEALARGMPVVCLDLGGPRQIVTPDSGIVVATAGRNTAQVAAAMAAEIVGLLADPARMATLSAGAVARARDFLLSGRIATFYATAANFVAASPRPAPAPRRSASDVSHALPPT